MKKLFTASLLVFVGFTLTGCALIKPKDTADITDTRNADPSIQENVKLTISEVFLDSSDKECTYTTAAPSESITTGEMYISQKDIYHHMVTVSGSIEYDMNYIRKDDWIYSWGKNIPPMKMQLSKLQKMGEDLNINEDPSYSENAENVQDVNYEELGIGPNVALECKDWNKDENMFNPPETLEFTDVTQTMVDFTEQFKQTNNKIEQITDSKCAACSMTPDENTKKECLASLGCN